MGNKTATGDGVYRQGKRSLTRVWVPEKRSGPVILQRLLFVLSFLTYGAGDGITAAYMMERTGAMREANPVIRFTYTSSGEAGVISIKIWFSLVILSIVWFISNKKQAFWMMNGFLFALFIGGIMAMRANLMAASGMIPPSPASIIMTYLTLTILFILIGDQLDRLHYLKISKRNRTGKHPPY